MLKTLKKGSCNVNVSNSLSKRHGAFIRINTVFTVKILKFGTPQTIAIIVLIIEKFDVTLH